MKKYANIVLLAILTALFYRTPSFLIQSVEDSVGKLSWIIFIFVTYQMLDKVSAVILAIIMITLLHQTTTEGFEGQEEDEVEEEVEEEEGEEEEDQPKKDKPKKKVSKKKEEESKEGEDEDEKEGFELLSQTDKNCESYDKEGFSGFTELLKKFKIPVTTTNTTDLDRYLKTSSERSTLESTME
jgi:hypothetical protein